MRVVLLIVAALLYSLGGLFMKYSDGLTRWKPTLALFALFCAAAACQSVAMKRAELGSTYILVLGLEAIAAFGLSAVVFGERANAGKLLAIVLIAAGVALLDRS